MRESRYGVGLGWPMVLGNHLCLLVHYSMVRNTRRFSYTSVFDVSNYCCYASHLFTHFACDDWLSHLCELQEAWGIGFGPKGQMGLARADVVLSFLGSAHRSGMPLNRSCSVVSD